MSAIIPIPRIPITTRLATAGDLPFIDGLQKANTRQVGWMPTTQLETKIAAGSVLIAEEGSGLRVQGSGGEGSLLSSLNPEPRTLNPLGYCIAIDRYFKRDDVGIIYQLNVAPQAQRGLIGATLLRAQFERSAYGCRLYCCWCAQDIAANRFWEAMGFVPLAFRSGSRDKGRTHIFWQRRARVGDTTTPYWFPSQTSSGAIREDRLVLPIPPGRHWGDEMPLVLPGESDGRALPPAEPDVRKHTRNPRPKIQNPPRRATITSGALRFAVQTEAVTVPVARPKRERKPACPERSRRAVKNDPKLVAAARELRDRWLERVNEEEVALPSAGKYDIGRRARTAAVEVEFVAAKPLLLPAA